MAKECVGVGHSLGKGSEVGKGQSYTPISIEWLSS